MLTKALAWLSARRVNEIPNLTGVSASPRRWVREAALNRAISVAAASVVGRLGKPVDQDGERVVGDHLAVGRGVASRAAVAVPPAHFEGVDAQVGRDLLDHVFDGRDPLRSAEAAHRGIRRQIGPADRARDGDIGDEIRIVGMEHRALHDGQGEVGRAAAVGVQVDAQSLDPPVRREADPVAGQVRMPLAGHPHVEVSRIDDPRRPAGLVGDQGRQQGGMGGLRFLAAETARPSACRCRRPCSGAARDSGRRRAWISLGFWVEEWTVIWPPSPGMARAAWVSR